MKVDIDKLFRDALKDQSCPPPPRVWKNIARQLPAVPKSRSLWWYRSAAAAALVLSLTYLLRIEKEKEILSHSFRSPVKSLEINRENRSISPDIVSFPLAKLELPAESAGKHPLSTGMKEIPLTVTESNLPVSAIVTPAEEKLIDRRNLRNMIPLTDKNSYDMQRIYREFLESDRKTRPAGFRKNTLKIMLSGHFAPGYSGGNYQAPDNKTRSYQEEDLSGIFNMSGGIKVAFITSKRFSVHTGVIYTQIGQRTENSNLFLSSATLFSSARLKQKNIRTPLGNIKNNSAGQMYQLEDMSLKSEVRSAASHIDQEFGAIEIPVGIRYKLNDNKLIVSVSGGFSGSFIVSNKAYLTLGKKKDYIGNTENIRRFNVSTDLGLGVEYPLSPRIKIMLEPAFRYYLQSLSQDKDIDFNPYVFSVATGIGINF